MKSMLEKLYNIYAKDIKSDEEIEHLTDKLQEELTNKLDYEKIILLNKYKDVKDEELSDLSYKSFKQGFRASIMLMLEVMQD